MSTYSYDLVETVLLVVIALSSIALIQPTPRPAESNNDVTFIAAVFREDGVIVPFARYSDKKWTNPWESSVDGQTDGPSTIADLAKPWYESFVKPPAKWYLSLPSGGVRTVQTSKNLQVCSHCQKVWGLLSDHPDAKPAEKNECVGTLGIALSTKVLAPAMERLTNSSSDWEQLVSFLRPEFERAETTGLTEASQHFYNEIPAAEERTKVPLSMLSLNRHRITEDGQILFYFDVRKEYKRPPQSHDASCNNISIFDGWAVRDAYGNLALLGAQFSPSNCDQKDVARTVPFAVMQLHGKTFVVVEEDGYEGESYVILELRKDSVHRVLETYAGSC